MKSIKPDINLLASQKLHWFKTQCMTPGKQAEKQNSSFNNKSEIQTIKLAGNKIKGTDEDKTKKTKEKQKLN